MKPIKRFALHFRDRFEDIIICIAYHLLFRENDRKRLIERDEYERGFL
jgi:hypothetical protein